MVFVESSHRKIPHTQLLNLSRSTFSTGEMPLLFQHYIHVHVCVSFYIQMPPTREEEEEEEEEEESSAPKVKLNLFNRG